MKTKAEKYMVLMERLCRHFRGFNEEKAKAMWRYLKDINLEVLEDGLNWCIANERFPPTVDKIKEGCNLARTDIPKKPIIVDPIDYKNKCARCRGRGQIFAKKKSEKFSAASYSFLCICDASELVAGGIPKWNDQKHLKDFSIEDPTTNDLAGRDTSKPFDYSSLVSDLVKTKLFGE